MFRVLGYFGQEDFYVLWIRPIQLPVVCWCHTDEIFAETRNIRTTWFISWNFICVRINENGINIFKQNWDNNVFGFWSFREKIFEINISLSNLFKNSLIQAYVNFSLKISTTIISGNMYIFIYFYVVLSFWEYL